MKKIIYSRYKKYVHENLKHINWYNAFAHKVVKKHPSITKKPAPKLNIAKEFCKAYELAPIKNDAIVYESFHGSSISCNPRAILDSNLEDPDLKHLEHYIVLDNEENAPDHYKNRENIFFIKRSDAEYPKLLASAQYLVNNSTFPSWYIRREGQIYVNTWHGVPLKTMFTDEKSNQAEHANSQRNFLQASHLAIPNQYSVEHVLGACDILPLVQDKTFITATSRLDSTIRQRGSYAKDSSIKKILYAPTWRGSLHNKRDEREYVQAILKLLNENYSGATELHIKAHNFSMLDVDFLALCDSPNSECEVIPFDPKKDINIELAQFDLLISDYSSIVIDALAADIPTCLFVPDLDEYIEERGLYFPLDQLPANLCKDTEALHTAIDECKKPSEFAPELYEKVKQTLFPAENGEATKSLQSLLFGRPDALKPIAHVEKRLLTFMGGGLRQNGISTSLINLLHNINYEEYDVVLLTDGKGLKPPAWEIIAELPSQVMLIHRIGKEAFNQQENKIKTLFYKDNALQDPHEIEVFQHAMKREWRRIFSNIKSHAAIDFSGYRRLWAILIGVSNSDKKIIYQHNDLFSERQHKHPLLEGVFWTYQFYDYIASVSKQTQELNAKFLSNYYGNSKSISIRNSINEKIIISKSKNPELIATIKGKKFYICASNKSKDSIQTTLVKVPAEGNVTFVTLGRFSGEKNHMMLLDAFAKVKASRPNVSLYILGEGPLLADTIKHRNNLKLQESVFIPGFTKNALAILKRCDCFVLPSIYEGQPMVILEALTLGKPVIVTDIAGSRSALDGGFGHISAGTESKNFARALIQFCDGELEFKAFSAEEYNQKAIADFTNVIEN